MLLPVGNFGLDRAGHLRADQSALDVLASSPSTRILRVHDGRFSWDQGVADSSDLIFLGLDESSTAYFARHYEHQNLDATFSLRENDWPDFEVAIATHAVALTNWHSSHQRCPRCGGATESILSGAARRCLDDGSEHHPRSDPAVISLVVDGDDRLLLGRQRVWPEKRFSAFAGFVEPGESLEGCLRRELLEECGVEIQTPQYLGSQAWPFPASLMVAFTAMATNPTQAKADGVEIEEIKWFTRVELSEAYRQEELLLPPRISIARRMIEHWYGSELHR
ncbi:NADH pyrophosphatase [mine drainage metagenome]|uniref:NAD(+) diphosphatase n=1 Tax=mine drainage metagenome TaxID=410659 RepID=A0A1J5PD70_9ZZZZ